VPQISGNNFGAPWHVFELLYGSHRASVVAAGNGHLVNRSSRIADGVWRGARGKPVCMMLRRLRYQFNEPLMSRVGILVASTDFPSACPTRFGCRRDG